MRRATCPPTRARARRAVLGPFTGGGTGRGPGRRVRMVDAATFIDPVVPGRVRAGGRRLRQEGHAFAPALVRGLGHAPDEPVGLRGQPRPAHRRRSARRARAPGGGPTCAGRRRRGVSRQQRADAWWVEPAIAAVAKAPGAGPACRLWRRVAGAAHHRGRRRCVRCRSPCPSDRSARSSARGPAGRAVGDHLRAVASAGLGRLVLSGPSKGWPERSAASCSPPSATRLAPGGTLVVHSVSRQAWEADGRPARGGPGPGRPLRPEAWCRLSDQSGYEAGRCPARRASTSSSSRPGLPSPRRTRLRSGERRRRGAGGGAPVRRQPSTRTMRRRPTRCGCARPCGGRVALGDLRRGDPRRPGRRGLQALDVPRARGDGRRGDLPVHDVLGCGGLPGRARAATHFGLPQLHRSRVLRGLGAPERGAGGEAADELALLAPHALLGLAKSPFSERELRGAGAGTPRSSPSWRTTDASTEAPDPRVAAELAGLRAGGGADILFVGRVVPSKAQHELVKALWAYRRPLRREGAVAPRRRHVELRVHQGPAGLRGGPRPVRRCPLAGEVSDAALAAYFGRPMCTSRCPPTRASESRSSRRWWPACPSSPGVPGRSSDTVADAALVLAAADPSYIAAALHRVCTDDRLRATSTAAGARRPASSAGRPRPGSSMPWPR